MLADGPTDVPVSSNHFDSTDAALFDIATHAAGPGGSLPLTAEMLRERASGDLFGWTQNAAMGWEPSALGGREFGTQHLDRDGALMLPVACVIDRAHPPLAEPMLDQVAASEYRPGGEVAVLHGGPCVDVADYMLCAETRVRKQIPLPSPPRTLPSGGRVSPRTGCDDQAE